MFKSRISGPIEYDFQKSRVTGPWDHMVSVSAKKVKKNVMLVYLSGTFCKKIELLGKTIG